MQHKGGNVDNAGAAAVRQPWHVSKEQRERGQGTWGTVACVVGLFITFQVNKTKQFLRLFRPNLSKVSFHMCAYTQTHVCMSAQCVNVRQA